MQDTKVKRVGEHVYVSCHCTFPDQLPLARVHDLSTALEIRFKQAAPELFRVLIHPEPSTDNRRRVVTQASAKWIVEQKFEGHSSHSITADGSSKTGNS